MIIFDDTKSYLHTVLGIIATIVGNNIFTMLILVFFLVYEIAETMIVKDSWLSDFMEFMIGWGTGLTFKCYGISLSIW